MRRAALSLALAAATLTANSCANISNPFATPPRLMSEVPANRLAFRLEPDFPAERLPPALARGDETAATETLPAVARDFEARRTTDALLRTVLSPDGQRALALYAAGDTPEGEFRLDLYSADGNFLTNIMPADISGAFPLTPAWSPNGQQIAFIARESPDAEAARRRGGKTEAGDPSAVAPDPSGTVMPLIAPVAAFQTEQIYFCDRDGRNLRPLTTRDGLIYFNFSWSPDSRLLTALACKEDEWTATADQSLAPQGRPRVIAIGGGERLLDDRLTNVVPTWSPDAAKVATAYETDVVIYDIASDAPTAATLPLRDQLLLASRTHDAARALSETNSAQPSDGKSEAAGREATPLSFNPIVRLEWLEPDGLLAQTAFLRVYRDTPPIRRYERWHVLHLSPQKELLG